MPYVGPEEVLSPKKRVGGILEVIHDPGENGMSVARIIWDEEPVVAIRWNGNSEQPLGNPMSRRQPTWFVVGGYAAASVEQAAREAAEKSPTSLVARYREMANDSEREREAEAWSEGLIGDASAQR
ncbi:MAG TPA: hypothetical protein VMD76_14385 [Candidatus Sulfotelmatobacter sp.]|jgi:hypothetical protein|nr:hypothetical protein [Candidatus Sulfotelmatobacter sp.]